MDFNQIYQTILANKFFAEKLTSEEINEILFGDPTDVSVYQSYKHAETIIRCCGFTEGCSVVYGDDCPGIKKCPIFGH